MRTRSVGSLLGCALLATVGFFACSKSNAGGSSASNPDASGDDAAYDASDPFGDDALDEISFTPPEGGPENDGGPCAMDPGTYSVTYTATGGTADAAGCQSFTATLTYPPVDDGGATQCFYTPSGNLPICSIDFDCSFDDGTYTTKNHGFIQVLDGSYGGQDTKEAFLDADGGFPVLTCQYTLDFTKQ